MAAAKLRVRTPRGAKRVFIAAACEVDHGAVHAEGHWKGERERVAYVWPVARVLEIRWENRP